MTTPQYETVQIGAGWYFYRCPLDGTLVINTQEHDAHHERLRAVLHHLEHRDDDRLVTALAAALEALRA